MSFRTRVAEKWSEGNISQHHGGPSEKFLEPHIQKEPLLSWVWHRDKLDWNSTETGRNVPGTQAHTWTHTQHPEGLGAVLNFHNFRSINTTNLSKKHMKAQLFKFILYFYTILLYQFCEI